ncbi:substrate-binding domain-containing protein [Ideonella sp.]|uniref:substrate-binding domain-containing protein n=1 Tax=Ideonella sp. TaxID=1929293 RepID=UPI002B48ECD1|nr:substrate-binding domain-containing protein [Ideonella sp.]HJV68992.1 substrate-binding domain-containing protein [Ideonella sp.]
MPLVRPRRSDAIPGAARGAVLGAALCALQLSAANAGAAAPDPGMLQRAGEIVARYSAAAPAWDGPSSGPPGLSGKTLVVVADNLRNGGVIGVAQGVREAARELGWKVKLINAFGQDGGRAAALAAAVAARPDAVVLAGLPAQRFQADLAPFAAGGIPVVGWHAGPELGAIPDTPVAMNITTEPLDVARAAASVAIVDGQGRAGVVIFSDSRIGIAWAKAQAMAEVVQQCATCRVLEVVDLPLASPAEQVAAAGRALLARHGAGWTHALAINDLYFDHLAPMFAALPEGAPTPSLVSAGDGSASAFMRIRAGLFQTATVAEPLLMQGWQAVDEVNRLLSHQPPSLYFGRPRLFTAANLNTDGGPRLRFDPDNGYRDAYRRIWRGGRGAP